MAGSLQDQLLGIGLVDKKKAKKISAEKRKQEKKHRKAQTEIVDEAALLAEKAIEEEKENSRLLNEARKQQAEQKAVAAQIKQLIEINKIDIEKSPENDVAYNFVDVGKVKIIYINEALQQAIGSGRLAIVKLADNYELVPREVATKISDRDEDSVIQINQLAVGEGKDSKEDDPYAAYQIPDDLMW